MWHPFKKKPGLTREQALACRPVKNHQVTETQGEGGEVMLSYPVQIKPWIAGLRRRLGGGEKPLPPKKLQLDELGTEVWGLIDGRRRVKGIIRIFKEKYKVTDRDAEIAITRFLRDLGKRGLIGLR
jgi:hypothetical protein